MTALAFDPYDHALQDDPYPTYARLRSEAPFWQEPEHGFFVMSRHADIWSATRDDAAFSNRMGVTLDPSAWGEHAKSFMSFLAMDPPEQTRLRKLVSRGFTPRRVAELEPQVQRITDHYLDRLLDGAGPGETVSLDWIADLAGRVPMDVISEMVGVPASDRDEVRRLADLLVYRRPGLRDVPPEGSAAAMELFGYYAEHVAVRRTNPTDDLTSALLDTEVDGDRMTEDEVIAFIFLMVVAGNETTTKLLGNALYHLTGRPALSEQVFDDPDGGLVPAWIEESLRFDTSTQLIARLVVDDVTLHGITAPAGSQAVFLLGSANRDERVFTDAEEFRLDRDRQEAAQTLSFGGGRHFCLGANLARLESRVVLHELVRRVAAVDVDHDRAVRFYSCNVRGFSAVPARLVVR